MRCAVTFSCDTSLAANLHEGSVGVIIRGSADSTAGGAANGHGPGSAPIIIVIDDDSEALQQLADALHRRCAADYQIVAEHTSEGALTRLDEIRQRGEEVALVLAAQWMAGQPGV